MWERYFKDWLFVHYNCDWLYSMLLLIVIVYVGTGGYSGFLNILCKIMGVMLGLHSLSSLLIIVGDYVYDKRVVVILNKCILALIIKINWLILVF